MKSTISFYRIFYITLLFFSPYSINAKNIELNQAKKVAINLFSENSGIQKNSIEIKEFIPVETNGIVVYRIFNFYPQGYIIISADDNAEPLIGFGLNSNFSFDNVPPALLFLLEDYKKEMSYIIEKKLKGDETIVSKWEKFSNENYISLKSYSVGTFLLETTWGQGNKYSTTNYNKYCPVDPNTNYKCIAGSKLTSIMFE